MSSRAVRIPLESALTPAQAVRHLRGDTGAFALVGAWAGVRAILGSEPARVLPRDADPFAALAALPAGIDPGATRVAGGWFGVLGYRLGALVETLPPGPPAPVETPPHRLAFHDHVVVLDEDGWWFESLRDGHPRLALWRERLRRPAPSRPFRVGPLSPAPPGAMGHLAAVEECIARIGRGDLFQANLTLRLEGGFSGEALDLFASALPVARPRFGALFDGVVSLSPERFLRRTGRRVSSDPIKGTSRDRAALVASAKDAAEHVMIVDLMRNDLGRVCAYGTVRAHPPRTEPYADVWHLVSTVEGDLRPDASDADLLRATFPPGSVTGAPKVQAMKVIAELESTRREVYTGAVGYASPVAGLELSVAIRTLEVAGGRLWLGAGGGVVADSTPQAELAEAVAKATAPAAAVGSSVAAADRAQSGLRRVRALPRALDLAPRPDPALGLLETVLVADGVPRRLEEHLARLAASAREVYGLGPPRDLLDRVLATARGTGRLRIVLAPDAAVTVDLAPLGAPPGDLVLAPFVLPGGLGRHKWADRRLLQALAAAAPRTTPVLVDTDGAVLEASWANVFLREGDELVTPPADGRLLPGIRRAGLAAREEPLDLPRLTAADEVFLTSALRRVSGYRPSSAAYSRA